LRVPRQGFDPDILHQGSQSNNAGKASAASPGRGA
jgi:hypothetical protein